VTNEKKAKKPGWRQGMPNPSGHKQKDGNTGGGFVKREDDRGHPRSVSRGRRSPRRGIKALKDTGEEAAPTGEQRDDKDGDRNLDEGKQKKRSHRVREKGDRKWPQREVEQAARHPKNRDTAREFLIRNKNLREQNANNCARAGHDHWGD